MGILLPLTTKTIFVVGSDSTALYRQYREPTGHMILVVDGILGIQNQEFLNQRGLEVPHSWCYVYKSMGPCMDPSSLQKGTGYSLVWHSIV